MLTLTPLLRSHEYVLEYGKKKKQKQKKSRVSAPCLLNEMYAYLPGVAGLQVREGIKDTSYFSAKHIL